MCDELSQDSHVNYSQLEEMIITMVSSLKAFVIYGCHYYY